MEHSLVQHASIFRHYFWRFGICSLHITQKNLTSRPIWLINTCEYGILRTVKSVFRTDMSATLAQRPERLFCKQRVIGSIPIGGSRKTSRVGGVDNHG
jgi:hypothetical protein